MATTVLTRGTTLSNSATKTEFHNLVDTATGVTTGIVNSDIDASAAIANSKLNLASITQNVALSGTVGLSGIVAVNSKIVKLAKGADVASVAGAITLGDDGNFFDITGTAAITSITIKAAGTNVILQFDSTASLVDGSNLSLNGNFQGAAGATIHLVSDGTNWVEVSRQAALATVAEVLTGTSTTKSPSVSSMIGHEGIAKGWINMNGSGTIAINDSYNVSGITDVAEGIFTIAWDTDFGSANYAVVGMAKEASANMGALVSIYESTAHTAGAVTINVVHVSGLTVDSTVICVIALGDR